MLGLNDAVAHFNIGAVTVIRILQALNIPPGKYTEEGCELLDQLRGDGAEYKSKASTKNNNNNNNNISKAPFPNGPKALFTRLKIQIYNKTLKKLKEITTIKLSI